MSLMGSRGHGVPGPRRTSGCAGAAGLVSWAIMLSLMASVGCENTDPLLFDRKTPKGARISLRRDVQPIFTRSCALVGCHDAGFHSQNLILEAGGTFDPQFGLVNVPSGEAPGRLRVNPGDSSTSYIINKLEGTQGQVGGSGTQMPQGGPALSPDLIETIRSWIDDGARNN